MRRKEKYCCEDLRIEIENGHKLNSIKKIIKYDRQLRYTAIVCNDKKEVDLPMNYCPFCGTKFPESLCETFYEVLAKEYGPDYLTSIGKTIFDTIPAKKPLPRRFSNGRMVEKKGL
ncbi:hypothetical protein AGMMS49949_05160 [Alphaproteobacteria bacterium]|nr:hypothetical protein AGMMS49949_05160 [Alphaproteobacteria bacterium]GHT00512.1 hypothetical protein AGMMS50296_8850 [Alphaproteobacteria bacterium]